ncbi:septum formation initiator family protein [Domibacillus sp. 8LH]|jgi:cell division protein DivIC|uniref:FtsB family cell division protein n=1 Tax=Domibacillus TaxID=1433999 RepID=UPI001F5A5199|nr:MULTISPECIES: septum formation initiator family protein [Domibacillus]MCI2256864.1 septum formation initiator family protein [Domibacillus sp. PGB-M46]MCM3791134.1 septum formation initiator family protein [Domibacillus indicus]
MRGFNKEKVASLKNAFVLSEERKSMFKMKHKQKLMRRLAAFGVVALIILGTVSSALFSQMGNLNEKKEELAKAKQSLAELKQQQKESEEELVRLQDDEYIAKLARKEYFYSEDGEILFNIPEDEEKAKDTE